LWALPFKEWVDVNMQKKVQRIYWDPVGSLLWVILVFKCALRLWLSKRLFMKIRLACRYGYVTSSASRCNWLCLWALVGLELEEAWERVNV
jgi:hypothetical protein